ncbi:MAG: flippase-like domain-containing protein [bacterium]|nr:flippase-like domain-containing protein [bacterium]
MKKHIVKLSVAIGILLFAFLIYKIGPAQIWNNIKQISPFNFAILVVIRILYWLLRTICWKTIMEKYEKKTSLYRLFVARMCGHAISQVTPTAQVGSEATRIMMADCSSRKVGVASVIVDKTIEFMTVVLFMIIGVIILCIRIPLPLEMKWIFIGGTAVFAFSVLFLFFKQKKGLLGWILGFIKNIKLRFKFLERNREKIEETDEYISRFYQEHSRAFTSTFLLYSLLIMLWVAEVHLCLVFIGAVDFTFLDSFLVTVLGNLAFVFPFIPGSLGVYEATYIGLFALLGKAAGYALTLVLIRRTIALLLSAFGLLGITHPKR